LGTLPQTLVGRHDTLDAAREGIGYVQVSPKLARMLKIAFTAFKDATNMWVPAVEEANKEIMPAMDR
jgi:hypothetical protein